MIIYLRKPGWLVYTHMNNIERVSLTFATQYILLYSECERRMVCGKSIDGPSIPHTVLNTQNMYTK